MFIRGSKIGDSMKKILIVIMIFMYTHIYASFEQQSWSARATAMGDAFVAVADDGSAPFYNPAGIAQIERYEIDGMYSKLFAGLDVENIGLYFASATVPLQKIGVFNFSWASYSVISLYQENTFVLNYANKLKPIISGGDDALLENMLIGINLKYLGHGYLMDTGDDPVFGTGTSKRTSKYSFGLDLGLMTKLYLKQSQKYFQAGLAVFNIIQPDVGLNSPDPVPLMVKFGIAYPLPEYGFFESIGMESPLPAVAITYQEEDFNFHLGWENKFFNKILAFRFGTSLNDFNMGIGGNFAMGTTLLFELDYAFTLPYYIIRSVGNHKVSFIVRF